MENAEVTDDYKIEGTGPTAFGGFSFDPLKKKTNLWSKFSHSILHIPKFMLSVIHGQAYLTVNVLAHQHDQLTNDMEFEQERRELLKTSEIGSILLLNLRIR